MRWWFSLALSLFVLLEVVVICAVGAVYLGSRVSDRQHQTVVPINLKNLLFPTNTKFSEYYEPKAGGIIYDQPEWLEKPAVYTINSDTLNDPVNYFVPKPKDVFRIIAIGDSFTFGPYVNTADNWTSKLQDIINSRSCGTYKRVEVLNFGVAGYDIQFSSYRFRLRGYKYQPDLVLWYINDHNFYVMPQLFENRYEELAKKLDDATKNALAKKGDFFPAWDQAVSELQTAYNSAKITEQENSAFYEFSKYYHGPLVLFQNDVDPRYLVLLKIFAHFRSDTTFLDSDAVNVSDFPDFLFPDGHPNMLGHLFIASRVYAYLISHHLLCP